MLKCYCCYSNHRYNYIVVNDDNKLQCRVRLLGSAIGI